MNFLKSINFYNAKDNLEIIKQKHKLSSAEQIVTGRCLSFANLFASTFSPNSDIIFNLETPHLGLSFIYDPILDKFYDYEISNEGGQTFRILFDSNNKEVAELDVDAYLEEIEIRINTVKQEFILTESEREDRKKDLASQLELIFSKYSYNARGLFSLGTSLKLNEDRTDFEIEAVGGLIVALNDNVEKASEQQIKEIVKALQSLSPISGLIKQLEEDSSLMLFNIRESFKKI